MRASIIAAVFLAFASSLECAPLVSRAEVKAAGEKSSEKCFGAPGCGGGNGFGPGGLFPRPDFNGVPSGFLPNIPGQGPQAGCGGLPGPCPNFVPNGLGHIGDSVLDVNLLNAGGHHGNSIVSLNALNGGPHVGNSLVDVNVLNGGGLGHGFLKNSEESSKDAA